MSGQYGGGPYESPSYAARSAEAHARSGGGGGGGGGSYGGDSYSVASSSYAASSRQSVPQQQQYGHQQHQQYGYQHHQHQQYGQQQYGHQQSSSAAMAEQQSRLLSSACQHIKQESYYMKRAMESGAATTTIGHGPQSETSAVEGALSAVLDRAVSMLSELCTSDLTPKNYYEMHMKILDQMQLVEDYLLDLSSVSDAVVTMEDLYQTVQYCPKVVPRSYLQIAAGSALIKSTIAGAGAGAVATATADEDGPSPPPPDASPSSPDSPSDFSSTYAVLDDLIESVRAVQCPLRGLFLRHYLMQATRDKLPDVGSPYGTDTSKSCDFVLRNFEEMNKLWVRIQHMHAANKQQRKKRERERNELRILVGTNLVRLSQLEGVSTPVYRDVLLPRILKQVLECKDTLAQAYLMDCIVQVFPDEFHLETLQQLLAVCPQLKEKVNVQNILQSIMDRLAHYERSSNDKDNAKDDDLIDNDTNDGDNDTNDNDDDSDVAGIVTKFDAFQLFDDCIRSVHAAREGKNKSRLDETLRLQSALLAFSLNCYPANLGNVDRCLEACATALAKEVAADPRKVRDDATLSEELEKLLSVALDALALRVLDLGGDRFTDLLSHLPWENRRRVATVLLRAVFGDVDDAMRRLADLERVERLLAMIAPLLRDEPGAPPTAADEGGEDAAAEDGDGSSAEIARERRALVARLVHLLHHDDTDVLFKMYALARKSFAHGGRGRVRYTMLPLVYAALPLVHRVHRLEFPPPLPPTPDSDADADADADAGADVDADADVGAGGMSQSKEEEGDNSEAKEGDDVQTKQDGSATPPAAQIDKNSEEKESNVVDKDDVVSGEVDEVDAPSTAGRQENGKANGTEGKDDGTDIVQKDAPPSGTEMQGVDLMGDGRKAGRLGEPTPLLPAFDKTVNCRRVLLFLQKIVSSVATNFPELGFKLYLEVALAIDRCATLTAKSKAERGDSGVPTRDGGGDFPAMAYEFMSQAFILYEDDISDSKAQYRSIVAMVGTLLACRGFEKEDYEALITKTTQYGAKLLKKPDQCRMVTLCSHLFFTGDQNDPNAYRNPQRVLECLQRALKIADVCMASSANVTLFVEILDHYVFYFERENPVITDKYVSGLIALINEHIDGMRDFSDTSVQAQAHYRQILQHIARKKNAKETAERFSSIVC